MMNRTIRTLLGRMGPGGLLSLNMAGCALALALALLQGGSDGRYAVYVGKGGSAVAAIAAAGGTIIDVSAGDRVAVASSADAGFRRRLYAAGAEFVFNPLLALGCHAS